MAQMGPESTIEAVSERAEIAISTIYKHFQTRDDLFEEAIASSMLDWEIWAFSQTDESASELEKLITPVRWLFRLGETHPLYAKMLAAAPSMMMQALPKLTSKISQHIRELVSEGILEIDDVEVRLRNLQGSILQTFLYKLENPKASNSDADKAIEIAVSLIGVPANKARELCSKELSLK